MSEMALASSFVFFDVYWVCYALKTLVMTVFANWEIVDQVNKQPASGLVYD
jgi:hypothetical protein